MLYASALKVGDKIGFFSPSSPATHFAPQRFQRAKTYLHAKGFELVAGALTGSSDHYRSGSIQQRANELNSLIRDPQVRCIMATIGGNNSNSLLPYIDYQALKADPKIIIGYSDVTALLLGIYAKTGLITFYGPALVASFGEFPPLVEHTFNALTDILCRPSTSHTYTMPTTWTDTMVNWESQTEAKPVYDNQWHFYGEGHLTGRLIGGNLNTIAGVWGSPYMPRIRPGDILFIEDSLKHIANVERSFAHLKVCGIFDQIAGIVLGKHEGFNDASTGRTPFDVLLEVLNGQTIPIVDGFDCCHTHPMLTLPLGVQVNIDFDQSSISLCSPWLEN